MLLREDVVIVSTDANENADDDDDDDDDDEERALTEMPTQFANANNTHNNNNIYTNQQKSHDAVIFPQQSAACIVNSGVVNNSETADVSVLRFPLKNERVELEGSITFLKPLSNVLNVTLSKANKLEYVTLREPSALQCKCTDLTNSNFKETPKSFPLVNVRKHSSSAFPCYTVSTTNFESQNSVEVQREKNVLIAKTHYLFDEPINALNQPELNLKRNPDHRILFPLYKRYANINQLNKFPTNFNETRSNIMNAHVLASNITEFSTLCQHHNYVLPTTTTTTTTTAIPTMTQCQVSNSGHARRIQVQYNEQVLNTIENGADFKKIINNGVLEQPQQQNINDAKLAIATMAKNINTTTSSQNIDERYIAVHISQKSAPRESTHKSHSKNDQPNHLAQATPPPLSEILAKLLEESRDLLSNAIGTLNKQTFYADSQLHRPPTPATCSDVRDSSSQEVPQSEDGVSVKVIARSLPANNRQEEYNLELLPKFYALERQDEDDDELIWPEVDQLIEKNKAIVANDVQQAANDDKEKDKSEPAAEAEVLVDEVAMLITQIEPTIEQFVSEPSVKGASSDHSSEHQIDEMKFEMKIVKSNLPETQTMRRHSHSYKNEPNIGSLAALGQRPASALAAGTRTSTVNDMPAKYARTNESTYSASRPAAAMPVSVAKESNASLIDTKYRRSKDEPSVLGNAKTYVAPRSANLDTKYGRNNDEQSALKSAISPTGAARAVNSSTLKDAKYDRIKDEQSASKFATTSYGSKNYEPSAAKLTNSSTYGASRAGYAAPLLDSKYGKSKESSATNRSNILNSGSHSTNASTFRDSKYGRHDEPSATNLSTALHGATRSDPKYVKTNDELSGTKLSTVLRAEARPTALLDSKYAKTYEETNGLRLPHSRFRMTDTLPLVDSKNARTNVEHSALSDIGRTVSVDGISATIPKSSRLRRQRRMHSQGSQEQPEDTIERLNRLRARISGALSEVKGVLRHYNTDTEPELEAELEVKVAEKKSEDIVLNKSDVLVAELQTAPATQQNSEEKEGPVIFRFVKKVRRRSFFDENDEDKEKQAEELAKTDFSRETEKSSQEQAAADLESKSAAENDEKIVTMTTEISEKQAVSALEHKNEEQSLANETLENTVPEFIVYKPTDEVIVKEETKETSILENIEENSSLEEVKVVKETAPEPTAADTEASAPVKKPKKKIIVKTVVNRRASIAAVEISKIEPPITPTLSLNLKTQRRPSDSEAIVKKKVTPKITANDETASKVKIIHKVKRPTVKKTNAILADQNKPITITNEPAAALVTATSSENANNNNNISSGINDQANFSDKDTVTTTLAAPLVIDDASLRIGATKDDSVSLATIRLEEENAVIVAATPLLSPLRASETNSQTVKAVSTTEQLVKLVGESVTIPATAPRSANTPITSENLIPKIVDSVSLKLTETKIDEPLKIAVAEKAAENADEIQVREGEKLIDQKLIPAQSTIIKHGQQSEELQVFDDNTSVLQEAANATTTFNCKPSDVITSDIAKETSPTPTTSTVDSINVDATKAGNTATIINSAEATLTSDTSSATSAAATAAMPELQVKALQAFLKPLVAAPFNVTKDDNGKKKLVLRKLQRKNSTEKTPKANLQTVAEVQNNSTIDKSKDLNTSEGDNSKTHPSTAETIAAEYAHNETNDDDWPGEVNEVIEELIELEPVPEKKKRRIKKKVIIKRQPRKLSISDTFFKTPESEPASPIEELLEKPIEYVKVDSDEEQDYEELVKPAQPTKSCLKSREFQVGDPVMYAERYRKTQVRWKKGLVLERITSISYKLEVEGKEVPAHISYIKKFTDRKVNFSGKEYLEIDYEQIAEEEEKARRYSIWNMV